MGSGPRGSVLAPLAMVDLVACRREHVPLGAELIQALALGVAGLLVADVVVERVAAVGHLLLSTGARDRSDLGREHSALGLGFGPRGQGWPDAEIGARAVAHIGLVGLEQVEGLALRVA